MKIGILAIQGDFSLHKAALDKLNIQSIFVRESKQLNKCSSLIIPGGESTTISLLLKKYNLYNDIHLYSKKHTLFGTCAGSILMSNKSNDIRVKNFNCINVTTKRNAWGRQINSFQDTIKFTKNFNIRINNEYIATFIRAPKFSKLGDECKILATYKQYPVLIRNKSHLVSSFHPEINKDLCIYKYYLNMLNEG